MRAQVSTPLPLAGSFIVIPPVRENAKELTKIGSCLEIPLRNVRFSESEPSTSHADQLEVLASGTWLHISTK